MLPPRAHKILAAVVGLAGVSLAVLGVYNYLRVEGLSSRAVVTRASLTDVRERGDSDTGIVATYEFEVDGVRYHRTGIFGEVAADITPAQAADPSGTIEVRYLPEDPSVNEPVSDVTPTATRQLVAVGIGLVMIIGAFVRWRMSSRPAGAAEAQTRVES